MKRPARYLCSVFQQPDARPIGQANGFRAIEYQILNRLCVRAKVLDQMLPMHISAAGARQAVAQ
jgi:hypothetical protein